MSNYDIHIFNFDNLFWIRGEGTSIRIQIKRYINKSVSSLLSITLFCSRSVKSHVPQRYVLCRCLKNLTMDNPINHSEHLFYAGMILLPVFP